MDGAKAGERLWARRNSSIAEEVMEDEEAEEDEGEERTISTFEGSRHHDPQKIFHDDLDTGGNHNMDE